VYNNQERVCSLGALHRRDGESMGKIQAKVDAEEESVMAEKI
jgi:hypothetical protein